MNDSSLSEVFYKLRLRKDSPELGLANWRPLHQLNAWATSTDTYTLRALIMAYGWRPFILSSPRPHGFGTLHEARDAFAQLVAEASILKRYSVSPRESLADLFFSLVKGSYEIDPEIEDDVMKSVEITEVLVSHHDLMLAAVQDSRSDLGWYISHMHPSDGHLFMAGTEGRVSWVTEAERSAAWMSSDEMEALAMAKRITRSEGYYVYPLRMPVSRA